MQKSVRNLTLVICTMLIVLMTSPLVFVSAQSLDDLSQQTQTNQGGNYQQSTGSVQGTGQSDYNSGVADAIRGLTPVTQEQMDRASALTTPFANIVGTFTGVVLLGTAIVVGAITAMDLAYIMVPFVRSLLNPMYMQGGAQAAGGMQGGMMGGGMGMGGYGMRGGMMGGMGGMGGMQGGAQPAPVQSFWKRQWVSDEAVYCVQTYAMPAAQAQGGAPMGGAMGGMGGMGGMGMMGGMGGMGGMQGGAPAQPMPLKSVALEYLKKRTFALIIFAVCTVVLTSSLVTGCGVNLGQLLLKVLELFNGKIADVQIG